MSRLYGYELVEKLDKANNTVKLASEYVAHYFGLRTDSFLIDLSMELQHLEYFKTRMIENDDSEETNQILMKLDKYISDLKEYRLILERRAIDGEN